METVEKFKAILKAELLNKIQDDLIKNHGSVTYNETYNFNPDGSILIHHVESVMPEIQKLGYKVIFNTTKIITNYKSSWLGQVINTKEYTEKSVTISVP